MDIQKILVGKGIQGIKAVSYIGLEDEEVPEADHFGSIELLLEEGVSIACSAKLDWTLLVEAGTWPNLPAWSRPPEAWRFSDLPVPIGDPGWDLIANVTEVFNEMGELCDLVLGFDNGRVVLHSGDSMTFEVHRGN